MNSRKKMSLTDIIDGGNSGRGDDSRDLTPEEKEAYEKERLEKVRAKLARLRQEDERKKGLALMMEGREEEYGVSRPLTAPTRRKSIVSSFVAAEEKKLKRSERLFAKKNKAEITSTKERKPVNNHRSLLSALEKISSGTRYARDFMYVKPALLEKLKYAELFARRKILYDPAYIADTDIGVLYEIREYVMLKKIKEVSIDFVLKQIKKQ